MSSTVKCEWGPKIVQYFILIFKCNADLCFKNYMAPQKHKGFITYHFLCHGQNCISGAMYYPLFMLNLPAVSGFLWFSCVSWICLSLRSVDASAVRHGVTWAFPHVGCHMLIHRQRSRNWARAVPSWAMWCTEGGRVCPKGLQPEMRHSSSV